MDRAAEVQAWLEPRADEMAALLEELVAIETENPPGRALGGCGRALRDAMARLGVSSELIELAPTREMEDPCVVRGSVGEGPRTIYFHGHFDVVPAQDVAQFRPQRRDGRIVGRGAADMKGGLVSMLYGAAAAKELGLLADRRIVLHFVCDEETGSEAGSGHLRGAGLIDSDALAMVTAEPTGGVVWHASRGAITLRVDVRGREAHVGQAHLGVNAFEHMIRVAEPLVTLARRLQEQRSVLVVGGSAGGGANFNVVPGSAWFSVDRRFNPEEELEEELARLTDTIADAAARAGAEVTIDVQQRAPSAGTDVGHPAAVALARCIAEVEGASPQFELCPGVLETRWYSQVGIPAFAYGAGRLDVSHGPNEYIDEAAMRRCAAVYALYADELPGLSQPRRGLEPRGGRKQEENMVGHVATAEIDVNASAQQVWTALTDPEQIEQYMFGSRVETDWEPGSTIVWKGEYEGKAYEDKGEVVEIEPEKRLKLTHFSPLSGKDDVPENYHTLLYELEERGDKTHVSLSQDNNATEDEVEHSRGNWEKMLTGLKEFVERG